MGILLSEELIQCIRRGDEDKAEILIKAGADGNYTDKTGNTVLMQACLEGRDSIVRELLKAGADINRKNREGSSALSCSIYSGDFETYHLLLEKGATLDVKDPKILESFFFCASWRHRFILEDLLKKGLNPNFTYEGTTPLVAAEAAGFGEIVAALVKGGAGAGAGGK